MLAVFSLPDTLPVQSLKMPSAKASPYRFKESPYSSHSLLLATLPERGEGRKVLDLGCGEGYLSEILAARGYQVTGVEHPARVSASFPATVRLIAADLDAGLPEVGSDYAYVLCADVLEHLRDPAALLRALPAVMAPDGLLVASLPNSGHIYFRLNVLMGRFPRHDRGLFDRTHLHFFMWRNWQELFAEAGFSLQSCLPTAVPVGLALPRWQGTFAERVAERISYELARIWKTLFAYQFVVTARVQKKR